MPSRAAVVWGVVRNPQLRRLQVSFIGFAVAEHATWLAVLVYAYQRGGVAESGLLAGIQLLPATFVAPFAAYAGDRFPPERVLCCGYAAQSISMTATALTMWANQPLVAYATAAVAASSITFTRPVLNAILPEITQTPGDLVAANVVTGVVENVGMLLGPLLAGAVLSKGSAASVFAICGAATANSALTSLRLTLVRTPSAAADMRPHDVLRAVWEGVRTLRAHAALRQLIVLMCIGGLVRGVFDVLMVLFAEARLDGGGGEAGLLGVGEGVGAVAGAGLAAGLIGRARIAPYLQASALLFATAFFGLAGVEVLAIGMAMFMVLGVGESVLHVTSAVGIQRLAPDAFLARMFGVSEGLQMAAMALGSFALAIVVGAIGLVNGLVAFATVVLVSMTWTIVRFRRVGGDVAPPPADVIDRLLIDPIFKHLAVPALSRLAVRLQDIVVPKGDVVITEGQAGDRYYLIVDGTVDVMVGGRRVGTMGSGESFGETALLRDVPRLATVTCATDAHLYAVERDDFLEAVSGHPRSMATASEVAGGFISRRGDHPID